MSCSGCRVLRRRCSDNCTLRTCLDGINDPRAQGNATIFVSKFFGRSDLMSFIAAVPQNRRPALFKSLLFEACGRTLNPVTGAVGLLSTGNWHLCQKAVQTVLAGGNPRQVFTGIITPPYFDVPLNAAARGIFQTSSRTNTDRIKSKQRSGSVRRGDGIRRRLLVRRLSYRT